MSILGNEGRPEGMSDGEVWVTRPKNPAAGMAVPPRLSRVRVSELGCCNMTLRRKKKRLWYRSDGERGAGLVVARMGWGYGLRDV